MSSLDLAYPTMTLMAYDLVADHGLALPLFASSASSNALYVPTPSISGDPKTKIFGFELYSSSSAEKLEHFHHRNALVGSTWIDVFVWRGDIHVGTRADLWKITQPMHDEIAIEAPFTLLTLAEGADRQERVRCARLVHNWLNQRWGAEKAARWQISSYLSRIARLDVGRRFSEPSSQHLVQIIAQRMKLLKLNEVIELRLPIGADFGVDDLPELSFAVNDLGWKLQLILQPDESDAGKLNELKPNPMMVMRLRHGRGRTQTQIPLRVFDRFFKGRNDLYHAQTGKRRTMTLSLANGARNTVKLQLPEIANMHDPVACFEYRPDGTFFEIYDSKSSEGKRISRLLDDGLRDGATQKTQKGATWWRVMS